MNLFEESDSSADEQPVAANKLQLNQDFAAKYDAKKRGEELSKLKDKYGDDFDEGDDDSESSTDYSSEDDEAEFITPQVDAAILRMISRIRSGDAQLYDENAKKDFFDEEERRLTLKASAAQPKSADEKPAKKSKTVKLKDFQRNALLAGVNDDPSDGTIIPASIAAPKTFVQEEEELRKETKAAFFASVDDVDDEDGDGTLLTRREQANEGENDDDMYRKFLLENVGAAELEMALSLRPSNGPAATNGQTSEPQELEPEDDSSAVGAKLKKKRKDKKGKGKQTSEQTDKAADDDFLKNYILNRGWLDKRAKHRPTYREIVKDTTEEETYEPAPGPSGSNATALVDEDSDEFEKAEEFETKYNFRFEEAEGNEITTHARDAGIDKSVRKTDESRKVARQAVKDRKAALKLERAEELKRLKNLKRQEILDKLAQIRTVAGATEDFDFDGVDLEGEYDPDAHASSMAKVFDERFYENNAVDDGVKPEWEDDIDITDIVPAYDRHDEAYAPGGEAYDPTEPGPSNKRSRAERKKDKKRKRGARDEGDLQYDGDADTNELRGSHAEMDAATLDAIQDPEERRKRVEQYMDEYYKLDYEDMIGDMPTRFKYVSGTGLNTAGTSEDPYALSAVDILMATDAELNAYESLRRLAPYKRGDALKENKKRKRVKELRKAIAARRWGEELPEDGQEAHFVARDQKASHAAAIGSKPNEQLKPAKRKGAKERKKAKARLEASQNEGNEE